MKILGRTKLAEFSAQFPTAASWLARFEKTAQAATWRNFADPRRQSFNHADQVQAKSGRTLHILDKGNSHRLIVAINYQAGVVTILEFLTHADYERQKWLDRH
jgi:mRNA interferase HigB